MTCNSAGISAAGLGDLEGDSVFRRDCDFDFRRR